MSDNVPSVDRMWELMDMAYGDEGKIRVLGWADNMVMDLDFNNVTFQVSTDEPRSHEDIVLIAAIRVPHPDSMAFNDVLTEGKFGGG